MARIDYQGVAEVEPTLAAPDDLQSISANASQFGAGVGEGFQQAGSKLLDTARFYEQAAADHSTNNYITESTKILYGDPSKPAVGPDGTPITGPDGTPVGEGGYFSLRGKPAMDAYKDVSDQLTELEKEQRSQLHSPRAQVEFDNQTRRLRSMLDEKIGQHYDTESRTWATDTNNTTATLALNTVGQNAADDAAVDIGRQAVRNAMVKNANLMGLDPNGAILKADQTVAEAQVRALLVSDPIKAKQKLEDYQSVLAGTPENYALSREATQRASDYLVGVASDPAQVQAAGVGVPALGQPSSRTIVAPAGGVYDVIGKAAAAHGATPEMSAYAKRVAQIESGGNPNAGGGGLFQLRGQLAAEGGKDIGQQTGVVLQQARQNGQMLQNAGVQPSGAGLYLMHQQGPAGGLDLLKAAPDASAVQALTPAYHGNAQTALEAIAGNIGMPYKTAQQRQAADAVAKNLTAGQFVGFWQRRFGRGGSAPIDAGTGASAGGPGIDNEQAYLEQVRQNAQAVFPHDPDAVENVVKRVETNIHKDDSAQIASTEETVKDNIAYLEAGGDPSKVGLTGPQIQAAVPGPRGAMLAAAFNTSVDYAGAVKQIATATPDQMNQILAGHMPQGPEGFRNAEWSFSALFKAAQARQTALYGDGRSPGDPANYVNANFPDAAAAFKQATTTGDPGAFQKYVSALKGAYGVLGVPEAQQAILPRATAQSLVSSLLTMEPRAGLALMQKLQGEMGGYWPKAYGDLAKAGLPAGMQAILSVANGANPQDSRIMLSAMQRDADAKANGKPGMIEDAKGRFDSKGHPVLETMDKALSKDAGMNELRASMGTWGRTGADQFAGVENTVKQTALYLYLTGQTQDPAAAVTRAAAMMTDRYDFFQQPNAPPVGLPKGMSRDFRVASDVTLQALKASDVRPYPQEVVGGHVIPRTPQQLAEDALQGAKNAYWTMVPGADGTGAVQATDRATGNPVILRNGKPLQLPFSSVPQIAQHARTSPDPADLLLHVTPWLRMMGLE